MNDIFMRCKAIPAYEVAQREGLELRRKGNRHWSRCPFHQDKTPSLCFFEDGGWKCFSCGAGGDSAGFLAKVRGISPLEAAKALTGDATAQYKPRPKQKTAADEQAELYGKYCRIKHEASAAMSDRIEKIGCGPDILDDLAYITSFNAYWWADECLENLSITTEEERLASWKGWAHGSD